MFPFVCRVTKFGTVAAQEGEVVFFKQQARTDQHTAPTPEEGGSANFGRRGPQGEQEEEVGGKRMPGRKGLWEGSSALCSYSFVYMSVRLCSFTFVYVRLPQRPLWCAVFTNTARSRTFVYVRLHALGDVNRGLGGVQKHRFGNE